MPKIYLSQDEAANVCSHVEEVISERGFQDYVQRVFFQAGLHPDSHSGVTNLTADGTTEYNFNLTELDARVVIAAIVRAFNSLPEDTREDFGNPDVSGLLKIFNAVSTAFPPSLNAQLPEYLLDDDKYHQSIQDEIDDDEEYHAHDAHGAVAAIAIVVDKDMSILGYTIFKLGEPGYRVETTPEKLSNLQLTWDELASQLSPNLASIGDHVEAGELNCVNRYILNCDV